MLTKTCTRCLQSLPATVEFYYTKSKTNSLLARCKKCCAAVLRTKRAENPEKYRAYDRQRYHSRGGAKVDREYRQRLKSRNPELFSQRTRSATLRYRATTSGYLKLLLKTARQRAKAAGLLFTLTDSDIRLLYEKQAGLCALFGEQMSMIVGQGICATNVSIDRIDPTAGYTQTNVQLVQTQANWMKSSMQMSEFVARCKQITTRFA